MRQFREKRLSAADFLYTHLTRLKAASRKPLHSILLLVEMLQYVSGIVVWRNDTSFFLIDVSGEMSENTIKLWQIAVVPIFSND